MITAYNSEMNLMKYKFLLLIPIFYLWLFSGCGVSHEDVSESDSKKAILVLRINKIAESTRTEKEETTDVSEEISSLRVIIINERNLIEVNHHILSKDFSSSSTDNIHTFTQQIEPGWKKVFLLANEEKVKDFSAMSVSEGTSLTELLDSYENKLLNGQELMELLNSISFSPTYPITDNSVTLPYSSFYDILLEAGKTYERPMYLIPVATKYSVNISNMRKDKVFIKELYINSIADQNYLMPKVGEDSYFMNGTYWIDWLAAVADKSHENVDFEDNVKFNEEWGWIMDYQLPEGVHTPFNLIPESGVYVDAQSNPEVGGDPVPGYLNIPVFYLPESRNLTTNGKNLSVQSYSIKMIAQSDGSSEEVTLTRSLSNVKALFRNTHLILNIDFSEGYMHVYGEIVGWGILDTVNGYVTEETEQ